MVRTFLHHAVTTFLHELVKSCMKELSRFAEGLEKDLNAVENSVASMLSNGFVEGIILTLQKSYTKSC